MASLLSALLPGAGHVYAGDVKRGRRLIAIDFGMIALLLVVVLFFKMDAVKAWATLNTLALIMLGNLVLLTFRVWAAYDAHGLVTGRRAPSSIGRLAVTVVGLVLLVPHVVLGYYTVVQYSLLAAVFDDPAPSTPATTPATTGPTVPGQTVTTLPGPAIWDGLDRLNVLLIGSDVGPDRTGIRTDTMIIVSVDPETGDAAMISMPRNMHRIPLPTGVGPQSDCHCFPKLLNDLWYEANLHPEQYPGTGEPGPRALKTVLGGLVGLDIHYYAMVSLQGFVGVVDALGGVTIDVPARVVDETYPHEDGVTIENVVIEAGNQHLDGHRALAYARIRRHADDYARMNRQRCVLGAVLSQSSPVELLTRYGALAEVMKDHLETDIPRDRLRDFIDFLPKLSTDRIGVLSIDRDYVTEVVEGKSHYDTDRIYADAQAILADPTSGAPDGLDLGGACE